jgi:hypothetical protein
VADALEFGHPLALVESFSDYRLLCWFGHKIFSICRNRREETPISNRLPSGNKNASNRTSKSRRLRSRLTVNAKKSSLCAQMALLETIQKIGPMAMVWFAPSP